MKRVIKTEERKIALFLAILLAFSTPVSVLGASPKVTEVNDAGKDLDYTFTETVSEDGTTADIQLEVMEKGGNTLTEVIMPDGQVIYPEDRDDKIGFKQNVDGSEKNLIHYNATKNGTVKFQLKYQVPIAAEIPQTERATEFNDGTEATEPEVQQEAEPVPESEVQEPVEATLLSKVVDTIFPVMEVHAAGLDTITEERVMEVSYEVTSIQQPVMFKSRSAVTVTELEELNTAIANVGDGDTITVSGNIPGIVNVTGKKITLTGGTLQALNITNGSEVTLENITIDANKIGNGTEANGGSAIILKGSILHLKSNSIVKNGVFSVTSRNRLGGGGICATDSSKIYMYDGSMITDNSTANKKSGRIAGGGVFLQSSEMVVYGGVIKNNASSIGGGGVAFEDSSVHFYGGVVTDNSAERNGGGIYLGTADNLSTLTIEGDTEIKNNEAGDLGGGIIADGVLNLKGGKIHSNTAANMGGGIYFDQLIAGAKINVSQNPQVINNTVAGKSNNLELHDTLDGVTETVSLIGEFSGKIGITKSPNMPTLDGQIDTVVNKGFEPSVEMTQSGTGENARFFSDNPDYYTYLEADGDTKKIVLAAPKVTLDPGKGTLAAGTTNPYYTPYNKTTSAPAEPSLLGHKFLGWSADPNGEIFDFEYTLITNDITLYAKWIEKEYTVKYDTAGGIPETIPDKLGVRFQDKGIVPADIPTKVGHTFSGWVVNGITVLDTTEYSALVKDDTVEEITLIAQWEKKNYTVDFAVEPGERGGKLDGNYAQQTVAYEEHADGGAGIKVNKGSVFLGWSYAYTPEGEAETISGTIYDYTRIPITADITFVAEFAKTPFVSGISTGGYVAVQKETAPAETGTSTTTKIEYDTDETLPAEAGFKFKGADHHHIAGITFKDLSDREFTVDINSTEAQTFTVGDTAEYTAQIKLTVNKADGTLHIKGIEDSLEFTFAFEEDTKYSVSFKEEMDSVDNWSQTTGLFSGDKIGEAPVTNPSKPGYTFGGWSSDGTGSQDKMYDADARITDKDEVYYAVWTAKEYTIHYNTDGGTLVADKTNVHYTDTGLLPDELPQKTGHIFVGWEKDTQAVDADTAYNTLVADDTVMEVTLKAKWIVKTFQAVWKTADGETGGIIDGGTQTEEGIPYEEYATKDVTAVPASEDSELLGWEYCYIPEGGTEPITGFVEDYKQVKVLGNITFTAKFAEKVFVSIGTENGRVTAAKGTQAEEITEDSRTSAMVQFTVEELEKEKGTVTLKYAANIHHHLSKITFRDTLGHQYTIYAKDGSTVTEGPDYEVGVQKAAGNITVKVDETEGTIQITGIDTSLAFTVQFDADPTYKVEFFTEQNDPTSRVKVNDGLYTGNPVGDKPETDPVKEGYTFHGWSMDGTQVAGKMYDENTKIQNTDIAYYAIWEKDDSKPVENPPKKPTGGSNQNPVTKTGRTISSNMKPVKTGDATNVILFVILLTGASLVLVGVVIVRRRRKKQ